MWRLPQTVYAQQISQDAKALPVCLWTLLLQVDTDEFRKKARVIHLYKGILAGGLFRL